MLWYVKFTPNRLPSWPFDSDVVIQRINETFGHSFQRAPVDLRSDIGPVPMCTVCGGRGLGGGTCGEGRSIRGRFGCAGCASRCWQWLMAGPVVATWVGAKHGRAHRPDRFEHRLAHEPRRPAAPSAGCCDLAWPAAAPHTECCIGCNEEGNLKARSSQGRHLG